MRWLLVGVCWALVHLSAPLSPTPFTLASRITQKPRFYGVKASRSVVIHCVCPLKLPLQVDWFHAPESDLEAEEPVSPNRKVVIQGKTKRTSAFLLLKDVTPSDSGVYYCKVNGTRGPGTGLQVMRPVNVHKVEQRSTIKDALIVLQALMLASFVAALLLRRYTLFKKEEAIYMNPQDVNYEGLTVETCEGPVYRHIPAYSEICTAQAPWEN